MKEIILLRTSFIDLQYNNNSLLKHEAGFAYSRMTM